MNIIRNTLTLSFILLVVVSDTFAQDKPSLREVDRVRLAEAFRLSEQLKDDLWAGWSKAPFAVLLVTPDREFLIRHPRPSEDFTLLGYDAKLNSNVYYRERKFQPDLLATFPAVGGISTIVIGQAENTASKTSTPWVITLLHEHFHQLQDSQPNYYKETEGLNLSGGDQTGMWMLNYPFPYASSEVSQQISVLARLLVEAMDARTQAVFSSKLTAYLEARDALKKLLNPDEYKYLSFQLWKEGIARYTEDRVAHWAASKYQPSREFRELKDFTTFKAVADQVREGIVRELSTLKLEDYKRVAFYPLGAGEGLLLDRANPKWRSWYFAEKFDNEKYFQQPDPVVVQPGAPGQPTRTLPRSTRATLPPHSPADVQFMQGMIMHHAQAVEMTALIESRTQNKELRALGARISRSQSDEISFMKRWLSGRGEESSPKMHGMHMPGHHKLMPGMLTSEQMDALRKAKGEEFDQLFLRGMIQHHNGALIMVKELFDAGAGQDAELFNFATDVDSGQRAEIKVMQTMLGDKP